MNTELEELELIEAAFEKHIGSVKLYKMLQPGIYTGAVKMAQELLAHQQAQKPEVSAWISVKDRFPELIEGEDYSANVFTVENGVIRVMAYCYLPGEDGGFLWGNCYGDIDGEAELDDEYDPTHWQPLPTLPK